jgi:ubiquinone/menaquinone biosynthesis C-methylase UbiE
VSDLIAYHLNELKIAQDRSDPRHCMPEIGENDRAILDIGCGIGQLFVASNLPEGVRAVGVDISEEVLQYGRTGNPGIEFIRASGDQLPFRSQEFDLVVSRVTLPYLNIPKAIREIARVTREGGRIWLSLHPFAMELKLLATSLRKTRPKGILFSCYGLLNGVFLDLFGTLFRLPMTDKYRSFQTERGMIRELKANSFEKIEVERGRHLVIRAVRGKGGLHG